jgi:uncharacterized protein
MSLTLDENNATYQIRAYQPGRIQVNDRLFHTSIIIAPEKLIEFWRPQKISDLLASDFSIILPFRPAILLVGTGAKLQFPPIATYGDLMNQGIGVEVMDTHAACRTYNALAAEGREVVAALIVE